MIHVACCIANQICRLAPKYKNNQANRRELFSAACAAGVSVAFGAPIGGILYSLEGVSYYFPQKTMFKAFVMAIVASVTLKLINPLRTGKLVLFQVTGLRDWYFFEIPFFVLLGIFGGISGAYFIKFNIMVNKYRRNSAFLSTHPVAEVALVSLLTALVSFPFSFLR